MFFRVSQVASVSGSYCVRGSLSFVLPCQCRGSNLVDKIFTSRDCHLIFSGAVPLEKQRMDLPSFKTALSDIAAKKGLKEFLVRRMVTWCICNRMDVYFACCPFPSSWVRPAPSWLREVASYTFWLVGWLAGWLASWQAGKLNS